MNQWLRQNLLPWWLVSDRTSHEWSYQTIVYFGNGGACPDHPRVTLPSHVGCHDDAPVFIVSPGFAHREKGGLIIDHATAGPTPRRRRCVERPWSPHGPAWRVFRGIDRWRVGTSTWPSGCQIPHATTSTACRGRVYYTQTPGTGAHHRWAVSVRMEPRKCRSGPTLIF